MSRRFPTRKLKDCSAVTQILMEPLIPGRHTLTKPEIQMSEKTRAVFKQWLSSGQTRLQPLTFSQRELWETSPVAVADIANHICCLIYLRGLVTPEACEAALQQVVERQEVLRLSFLPGKNRPIQMIRQSSRANLRFR